VDETIKILPLYAERRGFIPRKEQAGFPHLRKLFFPGRKNEQNSEKP